MTKVLLFFLLLSITCCNIEVNTVDPQASSDIMMSKSSNLFIQQYVPVRQDTLCKPLESWIEYAWKNTLDDSKTIKEKFNTYQLLIKLEGDSTLNPDRYLSDWEIRDSIYGVFGSSNGVYDLQLKSNVLPDRFHIYINRMGQSKSILCEMELLKKNY